MVQISQIPGNIDLLTLYRVAASNPKGLGMVALTLQFCHPQAMLEAATQG